MLTTSKSSAEAKSTSRHAGHPRPLTHRKKGDKGFEDQLSVPGAGGSIYDRLIPSIQFDSCPDSDG